MRFKVLGDSAGTRHGLEVGTIVELYHDDGTDWKLYISVEDGGEKYIADEDLEAF